MELHMSDFGCAKTVMEVIGNTIKYRTGRMRILCKAAEAYMEGTDSQSRKAAANILTELRQDVDRLQQVLMAHDWFDGLDIAGGQSSNTGHALQKIQGGAFSGQNGAGAALQHHKRSTGSDTRSLARNNPAGDVSINKPENKAGELEPADHVFSASDDHGARLPAVGNQGPGCNITPAKVLLHGAPDKSAYLRIEPGLGHKRFVSRRFQSFT